MTYQDLSNSKSIEQVKFAGEIIPSYRPIANLNQLKITSSQDASNYLRNVFPIDLKHREAFLALFLSQSNHVVGHSLISIGGLSQTVVDPKVLFQCVLLSNASALIICHNHPSGNLTPSRADMALTFKIEQGCKLLDINLLDHIILTSKQFVSFTDNNKLRQADVS